MSENSERLSEGFEYPILPAIPEFPEITAVNAKEVVQKVLRACRKIK